MTLWHETASVPEGEISLASKCSVHCCLQDYYQSVVFSCHRRRLQRVVATKLDLARMKIVCS